MISAIIPVYNEEETVISLYTKLKRVLNHLGEHEIIFVDDGSVDQTFEKLFGFTEKDKQLKLIRFRRNFGQSAALACGFDHVAGEVVVTLDGDLQNDPRDIPKLLEKIHEGHDLVCGWRKHRKDPLLTKRVPSRIFNWLTSKVSGQNIHDFGSPFKAFRKEVAKSISSSVYGELHRYIPIIAAWKGYKISEVEVKHGPRKHGKTKYGGGRLIRGFLDLFTVYFLNRYLLRPMHFFGAIGLLFMALGIGIYVSLLVLHLLFVRPLIDGLFLLLGVLMVIFGVQFVTLGLIGEMVTKNRYEGGIAKCYDIEACVNVE